VSRGSGEAGARRLRYLGMRNAHSSRARERNRRRLSLGVPVRKGGVVIGLELHSIRRIGRRGDDKAGRAECRAKFPTALCVAQDVGYRWFVSIRK